MIAGVVAGGRPIAGVSGSIPTAGLLAWYKMDSIASGVLTDETGVYTGTIVNASLVSGHLGSAIQCNGSDTLGSVPHSASLDCSAFTVSIWVNFTAELNLVIAEKNGNAGWSLQTAASVNALAHGGSPGQVIMVSGGTMAVLRSGITVNSGTWRHIAATVNYAGGINKIYVDGAPTSPASGPGSIVTGFPTYINGPLSIGQRPINVGPYGGAIDNFRYYNRALSASEVLLLYNE